MTGGEPVSRQQFIHYPPNLNDPWTRSFDLALTTIPDALITEIQRSQERPRHVGPFTGAVYDASGVLVEHSQRQIARGSKPDNSQCLAVPDARRISGSAYFGGIVFRHFGHSLIESMSRLWALAELQQPVDRFVFQAWGKGWTSEVFQRPHIRFMLEGLGVDPTKCELIDEKPVVCEELVVPASTLVVNGYTHPRFVDIYDRILKARRIAPESLRRVYLSRRGLAEGYRTAGNEDAIEKILVSEGFTILLPEELPFEMQVGIMQGADVIAGTDGSQMHMVAFARPTARVLAFDSRVSPNQYAIEAARGIRAIHVLVNGDKRAQQGSWTADLDRVWEGLKRLDLAGGANSTAAPSFASLDSAANCGTGSNNADRAQGGTSSPPHDRARRRDALDIIGLVETAAPETFRGIGPALARKLAESAFQYVNEILANTEEGDVSFDKFGRFRLRKLKNKRGNAVDRAKHITFHPARRA